MILWRVCKSIKDIESLLAQKQVDDEQFRISFAHRLPNLIHRFLILSLFLAPILVAVGYVNAGQELTRSVILSLGLIITVIIIQDYVVDAPYGFG